MTHADRARFHSDPSNWKLGIFYFCRSDPRILVPKRIIGLGWTLNFARPMAVPLFIFVIALIPCAGALARAFGAGVETANVVKLLVAVAIIFICYRRTHRPAEGSESKPEAENRAP
jgi:hypothetical protein